MIATAARLYVTRNHSNEAGRTPQTIQSLVLRPASGQPAAAAGQRPRNRFLAALLGALSAFAA
jgi:hypothetical protein